MKFLIITAAEIAYAQSATEAALAAGRPVWDTASLASRLHALKHGDELTISPTITIVSLSGVQLT